MALNIYNFTPYAVRQKPQIVFRANNEDEQWRQDKKLLEEIGKHTLKVLALRHLGTMEHSYSTALYADALAKEAGYDEKGQQIIRTAAMLHDAGKLVGGGDMFFANLDEENFRLYKRHPFVGEQLFEDIEVLKKYNIPQIIGQHHKDVGQSCEEAQIVRIADSFDTITKEKYVDSRAPRDSKLALAELANKPEKQLNQHLVKKFTEIFDKKDLYAITRQEVDRLSAEFKRQFNVEAIKPRSPLMSDHEYRKTLAEGLNRAEGTDYNHYDLRAVIGSNELQKRLKVATPVNFNPEFAESGLFNMNLHLHTTASDGKFTPETLFEAVRGQVKKMREKGRKEDFVVAITDHHYFPNAQNGLIEALKYIAEKTRQEPDYFKGIKFIPGMEFWASYHNPEFLKEPLKDLEVLGYGINPFNEKFVELIKDKTIPLEDIIKTNKGAFFSVAHPIRIDFSDKVREDVFNRFDSPKEAQALLEFLKDFKAKGGYAAEGNYYIDPNEQDVMRFIPKEPRFVPDDDEKDLRARERLVADLCDKAGLIKSGGVDNHRTSLYKRK